MKRRIIAIIFFLLLLALCSWGCAKEEKKSSYFTKPEYDWGKGTGDSLTIWAGKEEVERRYMKRAFERYHDITGNELNVVEIPNSELEDRVAEAFNGSGEKPDILLSYGGTNIESFHPDENFYDFTDAIWVNDLTGTAINQTIYNGKVIGLPHWEASISGTLYNKKIFEKNKLDVPETQEEFMKICDKLLEQGITPMYLPAKQISMLLYQFSLDVLVQDSDVLKKLNEGTLNYADMPEMEKIVNWYREMAQRGYFGENYQENDWNGMNEAMNSGKYAMMLCWDTWLYTNFKGDPSEFGLMPAFVGVPEEGTFEGPNLALLIVNKNSQKLKAALNFITFMADPYNYNVAFEDIYTAPVFKNQVDSISTPQYVQEQALIERLYHNSTAWLRIRGFSQMDASCILEYMGAETGDGNAAKRCLKAMDELRKKRIK